MVKVVAPTLTPECYNITPPTEIVVLVVAPTLTPECYNQRFNQNALYDVVAPTLTPECYNCRSADHHRFLLGFRGCRISFRAG